MKIALIQMHIEAGEPERNFAAAERWMREAASQADKPDVIVLPEMWNTGYALERIDRQADRGGAQTAELVSGLCREYGVNVIAGSVAALSPDGRVRNTIYAFDRRGERIGDYSKIHLFRLMDEEKYLAPGEAPGRLSVDGVDAGAMICYDIRFPELARRLALDGAQLLFVPAEWPHPRLHHWRTLLQARAIENQMYVAACNRMGTSGATSFFGHSMVVDPWGEIVAEGGEEETIVYAEIDLNNVAQVRRTIPIFSDRRPELY